MIDRDLVTRRIAHAREMRAYRAKVGLSKTHRTMPRPSCHELEQSTTAHFLRLCLQLHDPERAKLLTRALKQQLALYEVPCESHLGLCLIRLPFRLEVDALLCALL